MPHLLELIALILMWRVALCALLSIALAAVLTHWIPGFTLGAGAAVVMMGFTVGLLWELAPLSAGKQWLGKEEATLSWPVAGLGLVFFGALMGGWASELTGSVWGGGFTLLAGLGVVAVLRAKRAQPFSHRQLAWTSAALLGGLCGLWLLGRFNA